MVEMAIVRGMARPRNRYDTRIMGIFLSMETLRLLLMVPLRPRR